MTLLCQVEREDEERGEAPCSQKDVGFRAALDRSLLIKETVNPERRTTLKKTRRSKTSPRSR